MCKSVLLLNFAHLLSALGSQIIKGRKAEKKQMMYMASVQDNNGHICGGFLVSEYFVMTAAHCAPNVVLGTHNLKKVDDTMRYDVKMCKHSFKDVLSGNDIMLLKVRKLAWKETKLLRNKTCSVAGWGAIKSNGESVDELQVVDVPIINKDRCQSVWQNMLPAKVICAGGYFKNKGIFGVVSFNNYNIYISKFLSWIKPILKKKKCY
uniref:Peptidase S1 domain-containing protein n=1 Tax=Maylandia zebra TaxID=106582 RepID=A0A3P9BSI8_9CICH